MLVYDFVALFIDLISFSVLSSDYCIQTRVRWIDIFDRRTLFV